MQDSRQRSLNQQRAASNVDKESEKKALSKADRLFLSQMKKCITFVDGHVLPLPLRKQTDVFQESKVKVESKKEDLQLRWLENRSIRQPHGASCMDAKEIEYQLSGEGGIENVKIMSSEGVATGVKDSSKKNSGDWRLCGDA